MKLTKEAARRMANILNAFSEGKTIQRLYLGGNKPCYKDCIQYKDGSTEIAISDIMGLLNGEKTLRNKPETKYLPFENLNECIFEANKHTPVGLLKDRYSEYVPILKYNHGGITAIRGTEEAWFIDWKEVLEDFTFADGTPFGKKIENQ